jgi:hypothetical protein
MRFTLEYDVQDCSFSKETILLYDNSSKQFRDILTKKGYRVRKDRQINLQSFDLVEGRV